MKPKQAKRWWCAPIGPHLSEWGYRFILTLRKQTNGPARRGGAR